MMNSKEEILWKISGTNQETIYLISFSTSHSPIIHMKNNLVFFVPTVELLAKYI